MTRRPYLPLLAAFAALAAVPAHCLAAVEVSIPWARAWPVVTPDTAADFGWRLHNPDKETARVDFTATLTSPSGAEERVARTVALAPGEAQTVPFAMTGKEKGVWKLTYSAGGKEAAPAKTVQFAYMDPAGPNESRPEFAFGIVAHTGWLTDDAARAAQLDTAAFAGCKVLRDSVEWNTLQPAAGQWNWRGMDDLVTQAGRRGIEIEALLGFTAQWAAPPAKQHAANWVDWNRAAPDMAAWRAYVSAMAARYQGRIRLWEPWNEPDLAGFWAGTTDEFTALVKATEEEVHRADPANAVMSPGFGTLGAHEGHNLNPGLPEKVMQAAGPRLNFHAQHEHGSFEQFAQIVDGPLAQLRSRLPAPVPPLFFNETAIHSTGGTEPEQARVLVKKASFSRARGARGYLWYDLVDDGTDPNDPEHHFGLLTHAMEPKPDYVAFANFARLVVPKPFLAQLPAAAGRWFLVFGDVQEKLVVFWNDHPGAQSEQTLLRLPGAASAQLIDLNGNASPLPLADGLAVVSASRQPCYLLARGATAVEPAGLLAGPSRTFFAAPGEELAVSCDFTNPTDAPCQVKTGWELPTTIRQVGTLPAPVALAARGKGSASLKVRLPEGADYRFGTDGKVQVSYEFVGTAYRGSLLVPVHYGTIAVPSAQGGQPDIVLNRRDQLFSFVENDPQMLAYRWKGPEDLSARGWITADAQSLIVKVMVQDNKHYQPYPAPDMWQGDCVQCAIGVPGERGTWKLGWAQSDKGEPMAMIWTQPSDKNLAPSAIRVEVAAEGENRTYTARLPRKELALSDRVLKEGFRFNLAVNDNDGAVRAHALQLSPGIVANDTMEGSPYVVFRQLPPAQ